MIKVDGYNDAIIGVSWDDRLVYDIDKMIAILVDRDSMTPDDAYEFLIYNVFESFIDEKQPIYAQTADFMIEEALNVER